MSLYSYKAVDERGGNVSGAQDAANLVDLEQRLSRMGLTLISGQPKKKSLLDRGGGKISRRELITFCIHLEQLSRAGVAILESLADLRDSLEQPRFREVVAGLIEDIEGGKQLSEAMAEHPQVFDGVFINLIRAGESSGKLSDVLKSLTESLKWQDELISQAKKVIMYPSIVAVVVSGVVAFLMIYLVPQLVGFIKNMQGEIPIHTKALIWTSQAFVNYWYLIFGLPIGSLIAIKIGTRSSPQFAFRVDGWILALPLIGSILRKIMLARFASFFAMMYASGITILECIRISEGIVGNRVIAAGLARARTLIADGQNVSAAFERVALFPPLVLRMLRVGENTGGLDLALLNVSYFYDRDVKESIGRVEKMIEPVMTGVLGLILGWVMLSVIGPIYDIIAKIKM